LSFIISVTPGAAVDLRGFTNDATVQVSSSSDSTVSGSLQGSFDGVTWFDVNVPLSGTYGSSLSYAGSTPSKYPTPALHFRYVKANVSGAGALSANVCIGQLSSFSVASLSSATVTGAGTSTDLLGITRDVTLQVKAVGTSSVNVILEGSLDGTNWFQASAANPGYGATPSSSINSPGSTPPPYMRFVRANLTQISGGGSVTANLLIGSVS